VISTREFEQAMHAAETAVRAMREHAVPPTPRNFTVWYAHAAGSQPDLSRTLQILISNHQEFTDERNEELYNRFFNADLQAEVVQDTSEKLHTALSEALRYLEHATGRTQEYGAKLDAYSAQLDQSQSLDRLRTVVTGLMAETGRVAEQNKQLEMQLTRSAVEIVELRENLANVQREAVTDALTGISNRKNFDQKLRDAVRGSLETGEPLSLLMADIDHFKSFNDTYGHQLGDQVLRLVARTLTECIKGRDTTARYGGEEFGIILPQTRLKDALAVAEQIRSTLMRRRIVRRDSGNELGTITVSIGATCYEPGEPISALIRRADEALYRAKHNGRNCVVAEAAPRDVAEAARG
jgi:diguanylate cyclase